VIQNIDNIENIINSIDMSDIGGVTASMSTEFSIALQVSTLQIFFLRR
jgi:hypothetical protein